MTDTKEEGSPGDGSPDEAEPSGECMTDTGFTSAVISSDDSNGLSEVLLGSKTSAEMAFLFTGKVPDSRNLAFAVATLAAPFHAASNSRKNSFLSGFLPPVSLRCFRPFAVQWCFRVQCLQAKGCVSYVVENRMDLHYVASSMLYYYFF